MTRKFFSVRLLLRYAKFSVEHRHEKFLSKPPNNERIWMAQFIYLWTIHISLEPDITSEKLGTIHFLSGSCCMTIREIYPIISHNMLIGNNKLYQASWIVQSSWIIQKCCWIIQKWINVRCHYCQNVPAGGNGIVSMCVSHSDSMST